MNFCAQLADLRGEAGIFCAAVKFDLSYLVYNG